jgi:hypothetical protein
MNVRQAQAHGAALRARCLGVSVLFVLLLGALWWPSHTALAQGAKGAPDASLPKRNAFAGRIEYAEFPSASLGRSVRYAVSLPPSYDRKKSSVTRSSSSCTV